MSNMREVIPESHAKKCLKESSKELGDPSGALGIGQLY